MDIHAKYIPSNIKTHYFYAIQQYLSGDLKYLDDNFD